MTIIETGIIFKEKSLCKVYFKSSKEILGEDERSFLTKTIGVLAKSDFGDKIHKFSMGANKILIKLKDLIVIDEDTKEKSHSPLIIYCIAGKKTDQNQVNKCMDETITQFLAQFSIIDFASKEPNKFSAFNEQLKKNFHEIASRPEDRFKSILF
ncbi:hypothetical protein DSAG12_00423 [Promethearchaeum syntrophicum]|uniref:Uncharacterized protein n=1 Tax=Promethearchaeum syntrophicum TaxID=2594042 RepID=A0A5B9D6Z6_9ARCH|nr:hypothetical protein [Candidatus Prometheoarchaeum syntrophicum]QEE14610.1 hypothetical protein DSAG12_00423 [Candidatus Prometheoarchaeum syntrophicum]